MQHGYFRPQADIIVAATLAMDDVRAAWTAQQAASLIRQAAN